MSQLFATENPIFDGNYSQPFGLGFECELIERAAKAQIIKYISEQIEKQQNIWDLRDKEYSEIFNLSYKKLQIPIFQEKNIFSGVQDISVIEASLDRWPFILVYARNSNAYQFQEDQFDTISISLVIEILCNEGPFKEENVHGVEGIEGMQILNSKLQRVVDAVLLCIKKDTSLSGTVMEIEKPPKVQTSLPWSRKESGNTVTGNTFIFQGKQLDYTVQKITV